MGVKQVGSLMTHVIILMLLIVSLLTGREVWPFQLLNAPHGTTFHTDTEERWCAPGGGDGFFGTQCDPLAANKTVNVKYWLNTAGFRTGWDTAIQAAAGTWNAEPPDLTLTFVGTTTAREAEDNFNVIMAEDLGGPDPTGLVVATRTRVKEEFQPITTSSEFPTPSENTSTMARIVDVDVKINTNPSLPWWAGSACPSASSVDLQSVMTGTFGFFLSLGPLTQSQVGALSPRPVMYNIFDLGECRRTLHSDDKAGIWYLYQLDFR